MTPSRHRTSRDTFILFMTASSISIWYQWSPVQCSIVYIVALLCPLHGQQSNHYQLLFHILHLHWTLKFMMHYFRISAVLEADQLLFIFITNFMQVLWPYDLMMQTSWADMMWCFHAMASQYHLSQCHSIKLSQHYSITVSQLHSVTASRCNNVVASQCQTVTVS